LFPKLLLTDAVEKRLVISGDSWFRLSDSVNDGGRIMMGRQRGDQSQLFYLFNLEERIPAGHLLRKINPTVTRVLADLREKLAPFYSDIGRPSIDPELMIRMLIVGYCYGVRFERQLCQEVELHLAYRWFCRDSRSDMPFARLFPFDIAKPQWSDATFFSRAVWTCFLASSLQAVVFSPDGDAVRKAQCVSWPARWSRSAPPGRIKKLPAKSCLAR
jgi:hypothetical protein